MKTAMIARFVMGAGAIFAVAGLAGCGAETGQGAAEGVGSTVQAVTAADVDFAASMPTGKERAFFASCTLNTASNGSGSDLLVTFGGELTSSTYSREAFAYKPSNNTWYGPFTPPAGVLTNGVSRNAMIKRPGVLNECLSFGGKNSAAQDAIVSLVASVDGMGNPVLTLSQKGKLGTARSNLQVAQCGDTDVLVAGGFASAASGVIEHWHNDTGTNTIALFTNKNASPATVTLNQVRYDFAIAETDSTHIVLAGGSTGTGESEKVEAIKIKSTTDCSLDSTAVASPSLDHPLDISSLSSAGTARLGQSAAVGRAELVGFYNGSLTSPARDKFVFAVGQNGGSASTRQDLITIDWATPANSIGVTTAAPTNVVASQGPAFALVSNTRAFLAGGLGVGDVQDFNASSWTSTSLDKNSNPLVARYGATAQYIANKVYVVGGLDGTTYYKDMLKISP